jgi:HlyD family secretion protein
MTRALPIAVLVLIAGAASAWWYQVRGPGSGSGQPPDTLVIYGNVDIREVQLGFRVPGRVGEVFAEEGDTIQAGAILARLDAAPYQDEVAAARAELAARSATLKKLQAGPRPAEIDQARAILNERLADHANAQRDYERSSQLWTNRAISRSEYESSLTARDMAAARVASAEEALRLLEEGTRPEDIAVAQAELQAAEARQSAAQTSLSDTELRAPNDGIILSRVREPGAIVAPGDSIFVLSLTEPVWVRAYVDEPHLGHIHPGMIVQVVTDTSPDRPYAGQIGFISPVAEFTPKSVETPELRTDLVYRLRVIIEQADTGLRQGMPVTVRIPLGADES